ncbi:MAG: tRNA (guanosine(46)-N7)-methyltransferase TrmB [Flavobacteriia bacterium]|nr:tRNA (guanosine(46)-N7)-methyltransferase TrmB [Flavobacteriia bacterium]OJX39786.1 MAG: tRNA (guanosine(46)-N7)-methyltransferase TrmB [Flavobacteriia bacterium 40-80]
MGKNKLRRFDEMKGMPNCFEPMAETLSEEPFPLKGKWRTDYFRNDNPIVLELGCGKGEYCIGLSRHYPEKNFIGVDIKGARMWVGAKQALESNLSNVAFLRTRIELIERYFDTDEVDEIWLTFSDPQPNKPKKRLSSKIFIERYKKFLKKGGIIHLKTDSDLLFESTLEEINEHRYEMLECTKDLYAELPENLDEKTKDILHIKTHYEKLFTAKGSIIKYCTFKVH